MLEALMYLFENYMDIDHSRPPTPEKIAIEMVHAGFPLESVQDAFYWFGELAHRLENLEAKTRKGTFCHHTTRVYTPEECEKMSEAARGYLLHLEQINIIDSLLREIIIDRAMALQEDGVNVACMKWVSLMVLYSCVDREEELCRLEKSLLLDNGNVQRSN